MAVTSVHAHTAPTRSACGTPRTVLRHTNSPCRGTSVALRSQPEQQQQASTVSIQSPPPVSPQRLGPTGLNVGQHRPTSAAGWAEMAATLRQANVRVIAPQELAWLREKGAVLVDIRPADKYSEGHLPGASNVPFYQPIQGWTPWQVARRAGYALFGISQGTEVNPNFLAEVRQLVPEPESTPVVLYCSLGGSLEPTKNDKNGYQTRSMVASYNLVLAGFKNVCVLKGGYFEWIANDREIEVFE